MLILLSFLSFEQFSSWQYLTDISPQLGQSHWELPRHCLPPSQVKIQKLNRTTRQTEHNVLLHPPQNAWSFPVTSPNKPGASWAPIPSPCIDSSLGQTLDEMTCWLYSIYINGGMRGKSAACSRDIPCGISWGRAASLSRFRRHTYRTVAIFT
jgi:hypothetical protein